jgi:hypothetical protein
VGAVVATVVAAVVVVTVVVVPPPPQAASDRTITIAIASESNFLILNPLLISFFGVYSTRQARRVAPEPDNRIRQTFVRQRLRKFY